VQYVALRNILLIIQRRPTVLRNDVKVFFCKYNDPVYVKLAKLEIMYRLANPDNAKTVLAELQESVSLVSIYPDRISIPGMIDFIDIGTRPNWTSTLFASQFALLVG
jgi:vesicle coat complex subunit